MVLGFTGTRHGMTARQNRQFTSIVKEWYGQARQFHHGCCVGADYDAHRIVRGHIPIHAHPPDHHRYMMPENAISQSDCVEAEKPYHERNREIVDACDLLIVAPAEPIEQDQGGTWGTFRYARDKGIPVLFIWP